MTWSRIIAMTMLVSLAACERVAPAPEPAKEAPAAGITGDVAQASYSVGYMVASNMDDQFAGKLDSTAFVSGVRDRLEGKDRQVSQADAERSLKILTQQLQEAMATKAQDNLDAGAKFLEENGKREGVVTTDSGLQYEVLVAGDGAKPTLTDTVRTHYQGTLIDGKIFDSSIARGQPISFPLNGVISGWTEALQLMPVGSKWRLFIPPELAYGNRAAGDIPPNSTLIFDVELLGIENADAG